MIKMSIIGYLVHIKKVENCLRQIKINELYKQYGNKMTRKKINRILIKDLKDELGLKDDGDFKLVQKRNGVKKKR